MDHEHRSLIPELLEAFARFLEGGAKTDPQCWAKNAIAKALSRFEYQEPELYLTGMQTVQLEAVWGGTSDTAGVLRGVCALGLVQCRELSNVQLLAHLLPLFADKELSVRVNAARAVEQVGTDASGLLLRLRAELASDEPELLGACYAGVLRLEGGSAISWATRFLRVDAPDAASGEAAFAIADTHTEEAFRVLHKAWKFTRDTDFRATLLLAIALTRQEEAYEFLLAEAAKDNVAARDALQNASVPEPVLQRLKQELR